MIRKKNPQQHFWNAEKCDYFNGDWIPNPSGPVYTNDSCDLIVSHQNCLKNGRPDRDFLYWRWAPRECDLPQFDPKRFLNLMRNKAWALIGDSISRNHVQSLVCILSKVCLHTLWIVLLANMKRLSLFFSFMMDKASRSAQMLFSFLYDLCECFWGSDNCLLYLCIWTRFCFSFQFPNLGNLFTLSNIVKNWLLFVWETICLDALVCIN